MRRTGAHLVVESLAAAGVRHLFSLSGNQILSVYDATLGSGISILHTRHEAAAVHMADAWGRLTEEPGVALVTAGPGHCTALQPHLDRGGILVADGGEFGQWIQAWLEAGTRLINGLSGGIGSALPMALAAKLRHPDRQVIAALGDGTFGFHPFELDTAARYRLPVVAVVGNDARWNAEYQLQLRRHGAGRTVGCELAPSRYERIAEVLGGHGEYVERPQDLEPALERGLGAGVPACVNVRIEGAAAPTYAAAGGH